MSGSAENAREIISKRTAGELINGVTLNSIIHILS